MQARKLGATDVINASNVDPVEAIRDYERQRIPATSRVVIANRSIGPSAMLDMIEERSGGKPFGRIEDVIPKQELDEWQERYRATAGFVRPDGGSRSPAK